MGTNGQELHDLDNALGEVIRTGKVVVSNVAPNRVAAKKSRSPGAASKLTSSLTSFLGLPLFAADGELVGLVGLANRLEGYDLAGAAQLQPMCDVLGAMVAAARREQIRRELESELRASEVRRRIFADHVSEGIFLQDEETRVVDINQRACESLGYEREELIGMVPFDFDAEITMEKVEEYRGRLATGETLTFDTRHRRKDGSEYPVEVRVRPLVIDGKRHTLALVCDIAERKLAEARLQESQLRLQLALAATRMGVWEWDVVTGALYWSPECAEVYGIPLADLYSKDFMSFVHPEDVDPLGRWVEQAIRDGTYTSIEFRICYAGSETRWINTCATVRRNETGQVQTMIGSARNITAAKLAADEVREQNAILQTILESTTDFIYMKDREGRYVTINAAAAAFIGKPVNDIIGRRDSELFPAEVARDIEARERQLFAEEKELRFEESIPTGHGLSHLSTAKNVCRDANGDVIGLVGITRDITAHLEAEEALRHSTLLLENIVENIPLGVFVKDPKDEYCIRLWNKAAESMFGIPRQDIIGRKVSDYWPKEQADFFHSIDQKVMDAGILVDIAEEPSSLHGGPPIILHTRKMPLFDRNGKPTLLLGICEDISERKRSDEALREAQRRLEFTLKGADVGLWDWDLVSNEVVFSEEWKSQLGYHGDEIAASNMEWESRVHPDDLAHAYANVENAIQRLTPEYRSEFRMRHKDGSWRWILSRGAVIDDPQGKPARMLGIHIDITERKRAEEALQVKRISLSQLRRPRNRCIVPPGPNRDELSTSISKRV